jgi:glycosyltransferase involved in cell wall biosynthesis
MARPILVIAGKDPTTSHGGTESYLRAYGRAAIKAGYHPHFFCVGPRAAVRETEFGTIHCAQSPFRPYRGLMIAFHQRFILDCVERFALPDPGPYLVHSFGPWGGVGTAVGERLERRGIETVKVVTAFTTYGHETLAKVRGMQTGYPLALRLQHWLELNWVRLSVDRSEGHGLKTAQTVYVNYDSVRAIIEAQYGPGIRFAKMAYSSEAAFLRRETPRSALPEAIATLQPRDAPLLVSVSRHDGRKGLDVLLYALAELRRHGVAFRACLVGGGPLLETHRRLAGRLGLAESVAITGRVDDSYAYLEHADVFVLPSLEEGSGSVSLLEAMQAGAAPVLSGIDGIPEDVRDGESALLVEPGDAALLAAALARLLADAPLRQRLARAAHERFTGRFSAEAFAADLRMNYERLGFPPA